jgi:hypothetical protein
VLEHLTLLLRNQSPVFVVHQRVLPTFLLPHTKYLL